jgi:hypothetical protein
MLLAWNAMEWLADQKAIGLTVLLVANANVYWASRIYSLMNANCEVAFADECKAKARKLSRYSK